MKDEILVALPADDLLDVLPVAEPLDVLPVEVLDVVPVPADRQRPHRIVWRVLASASEWLFGALAIIVGLAVLAALPIFQFLSLGYLLEAGGRVARTGRLRDGFVGIRHAARLGSVVLGIWLVLLPLRLVASFARAAQIIEPDGPVARGWKLGLTSLTVLVGLHIVAACSRGGKLRYFLWPFKNPFWLARRLWRGGYYSEARDAVWDFVVALRLPFYFWLGVRGFVGTLAWLLLPVTLIAVGRRVPLLGFVGSLLLGIVVLYLPFLQVRFAAENRFRAIFEWGAVRRQFRRAPWAWFFALLVTLAFALPLYLLKIEIVPREAAWLPSLLFVVFIFPARLLTGWAYSRSVRYEQPRFWLFRWTSRLSMLPIVAFYVLIVYLSQFIAWAGINSLYEQHAFLLPAPFVGY